MYEVIYGIYTLSSTLELGKIGIGVTICGVALVIVEASLAAIRGLSIVQHTRCGFWLVLAGAMLFLLDLSLLVLVSTS